MECSNGESFELTLQYQRGHQIPSIVRILHSILETHGFSFHINPETNIQTLHDGIQISFRICTFWREQVVLRRIFLESNFEIHSESNDKWTLENYRLRMGIASVEWQRTKMQIELSENCEMQLQSSRSRYGVNIYLQPTKPDSLCFVLFYFVLFYFILFYFILCYFMLFFVILFYFDWS
jgi:hypothetical protein